MSQERQSAPPSVSEGQPQPQPPVTNLTLVVLLLIPCVVILLLLNCLFLGYKLLLLSKRGRPERDDTEELLLRSTLQRAARAPDAAFSPRGVYLSVSEPALPLPVTSSRASSRERAGFSGGMRLLRPDGATGSGSLRAPSSIRAASPAAGFGPRLGAPAGPPPLWCQSAPVLAQSSDSETETRVNLVPPNSPTQETARVGHIRRSSTFEALADVGPDVGVLVFDKVDMECETSCINTSAVASGLDSDFGASAGVSLRILSADSDGLSNGVLTSALEWDYYDPCYVRQNNVPRHKHHRPAIHTKQYWV